MKINSIDEFEFPANLNSILIEEGYWEDESFDPILITVEEVQYKGKDLISYQAEFEILDEYENIDGDEWEKIFRIYLKEKSPELLDILKGDSESSTCVIWTSDKSGFKNILKKMIELLENENEVKRIKNSGR